MKKKNSHQQPKHWMERGECKQQRARTRRRKKRPQNVVRWIWGHKQPENTSLSCSNESCCVWNKTKSRASKMLPSSPIEPMIYSCQPILPYSRGELESKWNTIQQTNDCFHPSSRACSRSSSDITTTKNIKHTRDHLVNSTLLAVISENPRGLVEVWQKYLPRDDDDETELKNKTVSNNRIFDRISQIWRWERKTYCIWFFRVHNKSVSLRSTGLRLMIERHWWGDSHSSLSRVHTRRRLSRIELAMWRKNHILKFLFFLLKSLALMDTTLDTHCVKVDELNWKKRRKIHTRRASFVNRYSTLILERGVINIVMMKHRH